MPPLVDHALRTDVRRGLAYLLDLSLVLMTGLLLRDATLPLTHADSWFFLVILVAVFDLLLLPAFGVTVGKALFGLRIIDAQSQAPGLGAALRRSGFPGAIWVVLLLVSPQRRHNWTGTGFESLLWIALVLTLLATMPDVISWLSDPDHRALHDFAARTWVVPARNVPAHANSFTIHKIRHDHLRRAGALLIDLAFFWLAWSVLDQVMASRLDQDWRPFVLITAILLFWVDLPAYGVTPGSRLLGLRIVRTSDGERPGITVAIRRVSLYSPLLLLIWLQSSHMAHAMEASANTQVFSDLLMLTLIVIPLIDAGTFVLRGRPLHDIVAGTTLVSHPAEHAG